MDTLKLVLLNTDRGIEIHDSNTGFVAEVAREDEGQEIVRVYNSATKLHLHEEQGIEDTTWGLAVTSNPSEEEFFEMPKDTAIRILKCIS